MMERLIPSAVLKTLQDNNGVPFAEVFRHGSRQIELYKPEGVDRQMPHTPDEVYVGIHGSGHVVNGAPARPFEAGEGRFVPGGGPAAPLDGRCDRGGSRAGAGTWLPTENPAMWWAPPNRGPDRCSRICSA